MSTEISPELRNEILRMISSTGVTRTLRMTVFQMINTLAPMMGVNPNELREMFNNLNIDDLMERMVPLYAEHLSPEAITAVADFYETDLGREFIEAQPDMAAGTQSISNDWLMSEMARIAASQLPN